jgi:HlyD family secretion protein
MNIYKSIVFAITGAIILVSLSACSTKAEKQTYTSTLKGTAIHVPSLTGGIINQLLVKEGDWVNIGDTLAILDTRELSYQMEQIDVSLTELSIQLKIAGSNQQQARTDANFASERRDRLSKVYEAEGVSRQNLDDAANLVSKSQTLFSNAANQAELLKATHAKLLAQKKLLTKKLSDAIIISPTTGKVITLYNQQGEAIAPFANLVQIVDTRHLQTDVYVSEHLLSQLKTGQTARIVTESGKARTGKIIFINNKAEFTPKAILTPDTRASMVYAVRLSIENPDDTLKDGMPIEVYWR